MAAGDSISVRLVGDRRGNENRKTGNGGGGNMFSIIKRHFHSSYGLRRERTNALHSERVSPRFSPLIVLSLFLSFFFSIITGRKSSRQYDVEKEEKR